MKTWKFIFGVEKWENNVGLVEYYILTPFVTEWKIGSYWYSPRFQRLDHNTISTEIEHWMMAKAIICRKVEDEKEWKIWLLFYVKRFLRKWKTRWQYHSSRSGRLNDHNICLYLEDLQILPFVLEWKTAWYITTCI